MGTEAERQDTRKAMAYDLKKIIDSQPAKESYTPEEVKKLIDVYIETEEVKKLIDVYIETADQE